MDGRIKDLHKCGEEMSKNSPLPSQGQREQVSWMALAGEREGDKGGHGVLSRLETPTGTKGGPFIPVGGSNRDKTPWPPYPLPSPPCSSHSAHLFLLFLARERGVLAHFFTTFVKIFDSPVHPSALKVCGLFFSSSLACVTHFML